MTTTKTNYIKDTLFNLQEEKMSDIINENKQLIKNSIEISLKSLKEEQKRNKKNKIKKLKNKLKLFYKNKINKNNDEEKLPCIEKIDNENKKEELLLHKNVICDLCNMNPLEGNR